MTYEDFKTRLSDSLTQELGAEVALSFGDLSCPGVNAHEAWAVSIPGRKLTPVLYPGYFFESMRSGTSFEEIIENIKDSVRYTDEDSFDPEEIKDYSQAKSHIVPRLIRTKGHEDWIHSHTYVPYMDLSVIFTYVIRAEGAEIVSFTVTDEQRDDWGVSVERLFYDSLETAPRLFPARIESIEEVLSLSESSEAPHNSFFVLTNSKKQYGAACMLYRGVLEDFARQMGESFYIIPSSVHEVLLLPESIGIPPEDMKEMLTDVNTSIVKPEEVLSDRVYHYDRDTKELD